jgi:hypothetical protein
MNIFAQSSVRKPKNPQTYEHKKRVPCMEDLSVKARFDSRLCTDADAKRSWTERQRLI